MIIYISNILLLGILSVIYNMTNYTSDKTNKRILVIIMTCSLFFTLGLRDYSVGTDIHNYLRIFREVEFSNIEQLLSLRYEIGFKLLVKFITIFTNNPRIILIIISAITIVPIGRFIYKYSSMPFLSFMIYLSFNFYFFVFSGLRQAIAFAIVVISYDYIREKNLMKFVFTIILASTFHMSAILFLPAYFITKIKLNNKTMLSIILLNIAIFALRVPIMEFATNLFFDNYTVVVSNSFQWYLFNILIYAVCFIFYKSLIMKNPVNNDILMLVATGITLMLFASVAENALRVADYYFIFSILLIPELFYSLRIKSNKLIMSFLFSLILILLFFWFLSVDTYGIVPYKF